MFLPQFERPRLCICSSAMLSVISRAGLRSGLTGQLR
jgi:hypothetical protein